MMHWPSFFIGVASVPLTAIAVIAVGVFFILHFEPKLFPDEYSTSLEDK